MQKYFWALFIFLAQSVGVSALSLSELPKAISIKNELAQSQQIRLLGKDQQLGLLQLAPNKKGTFYYFDDQNQLQNTVILKKKSALLGSTLDFDILNQYQEKVARLYLDPLGMNRRFTLFSKENKVILRGEQDKVLPCYIWIYANPNYFIQYSPVKITLDFFNFDSEVSILDQQALVSSGVDVNVFQIMLSLAYIATLPLQVD